ncbi:MAG TPA: hypothetical protein VH575_03935 [Gemmataceae bacterium]|jgi:hypothetical protein
MRSMILSLMLGLGVLGFSLASPTQAKAQEPRGPAYTGNGDTQLVRWYGRRGWGWGGYGYPYGGWYGRSRSYYYPRYYGGYYPWGYGYGVRPYYNYYGPGYYW